MSYVTRALKASDRRFERIFRKMGKISDAATAVSAKPVPAGGDAPMTAAGVLALVDEMKADFLAWKSLASDVLGDDTPAKKKDIIEALEAKIEAEKGA